MMSCEAQAFVTALLTSPAGPVGIIIVGVLAAWAVSRFWRS